jgi:hypothetical protein
MFFSGVRNSNSIHCFISAAVVLFVFLLPFHFHSSVTPKPNNECSCLQGSRTQLAPVAGVATFAPVVQFTFLIPQVVLLQLEDWTKLQNVRAPPATLSV